MATPYNNKTADVAVLDRASSRQSNQSVGRAIFKAFMTLHEMCATLYISEERPTNAVVQVHLARYRYVQTALRELKYFTDEQMDVFFPNLGPGVGPDLLLAVASGGSEFLRAEAVSLDNK